MSQGQKLCSLQQDVTFFDNFYKNLFSHLTGKDFALYVILLNTSTSLLECFVGCIKKLKRYIYKFEKDNELEGLKKTQKKYVYYKYFKDFNKNL